MKKKNENNQLCLSNNAGFLTNQQPICCQLNANYLPLISDAVMAKTFYAQTQSFIVIENHRNTNILYYIISFYYRSDGD